MVDKPKITIDFDREVQEGQALAVDIHGKPLGFFPVPGGRPPDGTVKIVFSIEDYGRLMRAAGGSDPRQ